MSAHGDHGLILLLLFDPRDSLRGDRTSPELPGLGPETQRLCGLLMARKATTCEHWGWTQASSCCLPVDAVLALSRSASPAWVSGGHLQLCLETCSSIASGRSSCPSPWLCRRPRGFLGCSCTHGLQHPHTQLHLCRGLGLIFLHIPVLKVSKIW